MSGAEGQSMEQFAALGGAAAVRGEEHGGAEDSESDTVSMESYDETEMLASNARQAATPDLGFGDADDDEDDAANMSDFGEAAEGLEDAKDADIEAMQQYFWDKLIEFVGDLKGDDSMLMRWKIQVVKHTGGLSAGTIDVYYYAPPPKNKKYRSRVEVAISLGLLPYARTIKSMNRQQLHFMAVEAREKYLLPLLMLEAQASDLPLSDALVSFQEAATPLIATLRESENIGTNDKADSASTRFLCIGNTTVLNWGTVIPQPGFFTATQIFPVGFRCIRQEHDVVLDRVVDCLCEVLEKPDPVPAGDDQPPSTMPWFRITIAWDIEGTPCLRVYEGATPREVWQQILLETVGTDGVLPGDDFAEPSASLVANGSGETHGDEEEQLRGEMNDLRRKYVSLMRKLTAWKHVATRLEGIDLDGLFEDTVLRLVEGMENSIDCKTYQFLDTRANVSGKKHLLKQLNASAVKMKNLDRVKKKHTVERDKEELRRKKLEEMEAKRRAKLELRQEKLDRQLRDKATREKAKDIEKMVRGVRATFEKQLPDRRQQVGARLRLLSQQEESNRQPSELSIDKHAAMEIARTYPFTADTQHSPELPSDMMARLMQVWDFVCTFGPDLNSPVVPPLDELLATLQQLGLEQSRIDLHQHRAINTDALHHMAMAVLKSLIHEYHKFVGLDAFGLSVDEIGLPVNRHTWQEVARQLLWGIASKDLGLLDQDIIYNLRSRGSQYTVDTADRRALKLIRDRLAFQYSTDKYAHNAPRALGFESGLIVRIRMPSIPHRINGQWDGLLQRLRRMSTGSANKIRQLIKRAIDVAIDETLKQKLSYALRDEHGRYREPAQMKQAAVEALAKHVADACSSCTSSDAAALTRTSSAQRQTVVLSVNAITEQTLSRMKAVAEAVPSMDTLDVVNRHAISAEDDDEVFGATGDGVDEEDEEDDEEKIELEEQAENGEAEGKSLQPENLWETPTAHLSESLRRMVAVLNEMMSSKEAAHFLYAVDPKAHPDYYSVIRHPICLRDIHAAVVEGKYESIAEIIDDCHLVFDNCRCYNHEYSPLVQALEKLCFMFERLLLDWVLDIALPESKIGPGRCVACSEGGGEIYRNCDRCDAGYHYECIDPPMYGNPKDWFCPSCVEERACEDVHPCLGKAVKLPGCSEAATVSNLQSGDEALWMWVMQADGSKHCVASTDVWQHLVEEIKLPDGFTPAAYDAICLRSRGHSGWGGIYMPMPPNVFPVLSDNALHRQEQDANFKVYVEAILALHQGVDRMTARDWISVLSALVLRAVTAPVVLARIAVFETQVAAEMIAMERSRMLLEIDSLPHGLMGAPDVIVKESARSVADTSSDYADAGDEDDEGDGEEFAAYDEAAEDDGEDVAESKMEAGEDGLYDSDDEAPIAAPQKRKARLLADADEEDEEAEWSDSAVKGNAKRSRVAAAADDEEEASALSEEEMKNDSASLEEEHAELGTAVAEENGEAFAIDKQESSNELTWELRRISRRRGREDLLFSRALLAELLNTFDEPTVAEYENSIEKICAPRPADHLLVDEWLGALTRKAQTPVGGVNLIPERCAFCDMTEEYIVSNFVAGQTWEEWEAHERSHPHDQSLLSRINTQELWAPANPEDAKIESEECTKIHRSILSGSVVVHEFCAEQMTFLRRTVMGREQHCDDPAIVDRLVGIGRAKGTPIGTDADGRMYWCFPAAPQRLFVEPKPPAPPGSHWLVLERRDVGLLRQFLRESLREERILLHTLSRLFPSAMVETPSTPVQIETKMDLQAASSLKQDDEVEADKLVQNGKADNNLAPSHGPEQTNKSISDDENDEEEADDAAEADDDDEEYEDEDASEAEEEDVSEASVDDDDAAGESRARARQKKRGRPKYVFSVGEDVFVAKGPLYWLAVVVDVRKAKARMQYKVHYESWADEYDEWVDSAQVFSRAKGNMDELRKHERHYFRTKVVHVPASLRSLSAATYLNHPGRARGFMPPPNFRCCTDTFAILRHALLLVHAALPVGALDDGDDRWNPDLEVCWMRQVTAATNIHELMECELLLEYAIKPQWLQSDTTRVFTCMPSRALALKQASLAAVALRLWSLDRGLKYDKVVLPADDEYAVKKRGRPRGSKTKRMSEEEVVFHARNPRGRPSRYS